MKYEEAIDNSYYCGKLKFFDEKNGFGFITIFHENSSEDIFVYKSEFDKAKIDIDTIRSLRNATALQFRFHVARYFGKYKESKKAINISII